MKPEEIKGYNNPDSPWRDRPIEESLKLFDVSNLYHSLKQRLASSLHQMHRLSIIGI